MLSFVNLKAALLTTTISKKKQMTFYFVNFASFSLFSYQKSFIISKNLELIHTSFLTNKRVSFVYMFDKRVDQLNKKILIF